MKFLFINCSRIPFIDLIMGHLKTDETRTRNMLRALIGERVYLTETGTGRRSLVRCSAIIGEPVIVRSREDWDRLWKRHRVPVDSRYDWKPETKIKYLYPLIDVRPCKPFTAPEGVRHGYVWMESPGAIRSSYLRDWRETVVYNTDDVDDGAVMAQGQTSGKYYTLTLDSAGNPAGAELNW